MSNQAKTGQIEIYDVSTRNFEVKGKDGKQGRTLTKQKAFLHTGARFPKEFEVSIPSRAEAYMPGVYEISAESYVFNQYNELELSRFNLTLSLVTPAAGFGALPQDKGGVKSPFDKAA